MSVHVPRIQLVPLADDQVSFQVAGREMLRWHFGRRYPRPFFSPLIGASGDSVTRMGHPAAPDHEHHRSFWFGHHDVGGVGFWNDQSGPQQIRQEEWVHYQDGDDEAGMVVRLGWFDAHGVRLLRQQLIAVLRPMKDAETWLELQTSFTPVMDGLKLGKTNFGLLGLRVAKSLSAHYGGGRLTNSHGAAGEANVHEKQALWMDYSGPVRSEGESGRRGEGGNKTPLAEAGVTWFDHPTNPNHPTSWHTRDDGWMSAAFSLREASELRKERPLSLRYGFHVHAGPVDVARATKLQMDFSQSKTWQVVAAEKPWRWRLDRVR